MYVYVCVQGVSMCKNICVQNACLYSGECVGKDVYVGMCCVYAGMWLCKDVCVYAGV